MTSKHDGVDTIVLSMDARIAALIQATGKKPPPEIIMRSKLSIVPPSHVRAVLLCAGTFLLLASAFAHENERASTIATHPVATSSQLPQIAPIGVPIHEHLQIPKHAKGPTLDAKKGYRLQDLGAGLFMITDNIYQSMFMVYETGVVVADAPPSYATNIVAGIREITDKPITHLIYSHSHTDHIGGANALGAVPNIIAHAETKRLLERAEDPNRPLPTTTFQDRHTLNVGSLVLELSYHGVAHEPGNIFIYAPAQQTLMVIDIVFPGWMPWRRFALAQDIPGYFAQVEEIRKTAFKTLVAGHVARTGTPADVELQIQFMTDLKAAAGKGLADTKPGEGLAQPALGNPWAVFDDYIDRVAAKCVNELTPKWAPKLAAYDVYIWDQCYAMEQSLRID